MLNYRSFLHMESSPEVVFILRDIKKARQVFPQNQHFL